MFCNFMTMVEHGWTSVLKKLMIEVELNLSKLTDLIMHQWLTSGTVPDRYPVFFTCPTTRSIKIVCPKGIEFSKSSNQYPDGQCNGLSLCHTAVSLLSVLQKRRSSWRIVQTVMNFMICRDFKQNPYAK